MTDDEIKKIIHAEISDIVKSNNLTDNNIIVKQDSPLTKAESKSFTNLEVYKQTDNFLIMIAKKAGRVVNIIVYVLGLYGLLRFSSMLLFEKSLPDEITLAKNVHSGIEQVFVDANSKKLSSPNDLKEPEKFIVTSNDWNNLNDSEYKSIAHSYLSGTVPIEGLYNTNTSFVPASGVLNVYVKNASSTADDFKINLV